MKMLVTGGNGVLGREVVRLALAEGHSVVVMTREHEIDIAEGATFVTADVLEAGSLPKALEGVDVIVHCATSPRANTYEVEVTGTKNLIAAAEAAGVTHFVYISIVGVDRIPLAYYQAKLAAESVIEGGSVPWTILRATQFHNLVIGAFQMAIRKLPVLPVPRGFKFQVLDPSECAKRLIELASGPPSGHVDDIGGPEILPIEVIASEYLQFKGISKRIVRLPGFGKKAKAFKAGGNLCPENTYGTITFEDFLRFHASSKEEESTEDDGQATDTPTE